MTPADPGTSPPVAPRAPQGRRSGLTGLLAPALAVMNRLSYPGKFALISLLFLIPLVLVLALMTREMVYDIDFAQQELDGVSYLRELRQLLEHGAEAYLVAREYALGKVTVRPDLRGWHAQLVDDFTRLEHKEAVHGQLLQTGPRHWALTESWQALRDRLDQLTPNDQVVLHHKLLQDVRKLMARVGDASNLILDPDLDTYYLMDAILLKLPAAQEYLIEARFLARPTPGKPDAAAFVRLDTLLEANHAEVQKGLEEVAFKHKPASGLDLRLRAFLDDYERALQAFHQATQEAARDGQVLPEEATRCQETATAALTASFHLWDRSGFELETLLEKRIAALKSKLVLAYLAAGASLVLVAYLLLGFYVAVMRTVQGLADVTRRMVSGQYGESFTLESRDELGQVAVSFNHLAGQLRSECAQAREESARATAAEAMLRVSEARTRLIIATALDAVVALDAEGRVTAWNGQAEALFGWSQADAAGRDLIELIIPSSRHEAERSRLLPAMRAGDGVAARRFEATAVHRDGHEFPVELSVSPMRSSEGLTFSAFIRDITERKQAEEDMRRARDLAEEANRAKSQFLATMSHEIRTPMNAVIGMSGLLLDTPLTAEQREFAQVVRHSAHSLLTIINDILDFSKIEAGQMELEQQPFDLRECVEGALDLVAARAAEKRIDLAGVLDPEVPVAVVGDVTRLRQVLVNLLGNAVKFTEKGEVVLQVRVASRASDPAPSSGVAAPSFPAIELQFSVRDTGPGISPQQMDRLFQAFSQGDTSMTRKHGGTGLGLVISKRLVGLMGGRLWVESKVGQGSTFHCTIRTCEASVPVRAYRRGQQAQLAGKRLLIVDDNATNRQILRLQAQSWGMVTQECASGAEVLAALRGGQPFDVAILDIQMPFMDGITLAREVRRLRKADELILVALSSLGETAVSPEGLFAAFLTKPIKQSHLYDVLIGLFAGGTGPSSSRFGPDEPLFDAGLGERQPLRILVVEDIAVNQKLVLAMLARMGYRADVAGNGIEALQALERQPYDLVLMDMQMPEMDGLEATRHIRQRCPKGERPRVIALTANAMEGDRQRCEEVGMDGYLAKPIQAKELQALLVRVGTEMYKAERTAPPEVPPGPEEAPVLDRKTVEVLHGALGTSVLQELCTIFRSNSPRLLEQLRQGIAADDPGSARQAAHSLRGSALGLGARALALACGKVEAASRDGRLDGVAVLLSAVEVQLPLACEALEGALRDL